METSIKSYAAKEHHQPVKRYCRTLDLRDDPKLIAEYRRRHSQAEIWPEVIAGIREVGILEMEIYILDTRLFMIVETALDFVGTRQWNGLPLCPASRNGKIIWRFSNL